MADAIRVAVRVRPFNQRERDHGAKCVVAVDGRSTTITNPETGEAKTFTFDYSWDSYVARDHPAYASQATVWRDVGEDVLTQALAGFNYSLFAYGQTGSGKSYSMMGYGEEKGAPRDEREEGGRRRGG